MGKQKKNKPVKNVFKVAGARSLKLKNKAKAVNIQLKKLNEATRKKTAEVNEQLTTELQAQLLQDREPSSSVSEKLISRRAEKQHSGLNETDDSKLALKMLNEMKCD